MPKPHNPGNVTRPEEPASSPLDNGDRLLSVKQVSEITGLAVGTLNRARQTGSDAPPFCKIGKACRYRSSSVQSWIGSKTEFSSTSAYQQAAG
jgi:predicted DNA-binding transcriptional regulator AlpA